MNNFSEQKNMQDNEDAKSYCKTISLITLSIVTKVACLEGARDILPFYFLCHIRSTYAGGGVFLITGSTRDHLW